MSTKILCGILTVALFETTLMADVLHPPASSVSGIDLRDDKKATRIVGREIPVKELSSFPEASYFNESHTELLTVVIFDGDYSNVCSQFEVEMASSMTETNIVGTLKIDHFSTENGIHLGLSKERIISILGPPSSSKVEGNIETILYRIDPPSTFLDKYEMDQYFAQYRLIDDRLVRFKFGFEYP